MNIGLFFGSFNPIHNGHLAIAKYFIVHTNLEEIWFVVSPQNPFKKNLSLLDENLRFKMVDLAIQEIPEFKPCNIEFSLPHPSYTINTINELYKQFPKNKFTIIIGGDNLTNFDQWKDFEQILEKTEVFVYDRNNCQNLSLLNNQRIKHFNTPLLNISSTLIRERVKKQENINQYVPLVVAEFIKTNRCYL